MNSLFDALQAEIPTLTHDNAADPFEAFSIDSFDLVTLRVVSEAALGRTIADSVWTTFQSPADIVAQADGAQSAGTTTSRRLTKERSYEIGMPQMAVSGLSEPWLFKEIGDVHWDLITDGLGVPSSQITDGNGERLYATFTRIRMIHWRPLKSVPENANFSIKGEMSRYGAGIFLSDITCQSPAGTIAVNVASSFAKRGAVDTNSGLVKGQPTVPDDSPIAILTEKPAFIEEYRTRRTAEYSETLFTCDYQINPYHDINGVGLLYFAAYPAIADTCELAYMGQGNAWALKSSTIFRDIYYFANSDADDILTYRVLARRDVDGGIEIDALISRKKSDVPMAFVRTRKAIND